MSEVKYDYVAMIDKMMEKDWNVCHKKKDPSLTKKQLKDRVSSLNKRIKKKGVPLHAFSRLGCICIRRTDRFVPQLDDEENWMKEWEKERDQMIEKLERHGIDVRKLDCFEYLHLDNYKPKYL